MSSQLYENEKMGDAEAAISSRQAFGKLLPLLKRHTKPLLYCFVLLAGSTALSLYWPVLLKRAVDVDIKNSDFNGLIFTVTGIFLIQGITIVLQYIQRIKLETIGQDVMLDLKGMLFAHILSQDVSFFDSNPVGRLISRVESDTEALRMLFTITVVLLVGDLILIMGVLALMFYYSWKLASVLVLIFPVVVLLTYIFERKTTPKFYEIRKKMAEVTATITEFFHGMAITQIFHRGDYARKKVNDANRAKFKDDIYANIAVCIYFNSVSFMQNLMIAIVLFLGAIWIKQGLITIGTMGMFIILIWRSFEPLYRASEQLSNIQRAIAGAKRIFALLSSNSRLTVSEAPKAWNRLEKGIRFEHVWFSYGNDDNYILKDVDFEIPAGRRVALAGVTGGGKSTIISLLLRFYDPQKGRITVDGIDIREIELSELRKRFALVLQDIILFPGDFWANIGLESQEIEKEKIVSAAKVVDADRFINKLPKGYDTEISEKGANLSRGERQLLSFARALAVNPDVLVLDEATSSVDPETEHSIQDSLKKLMTGRTSLVIAHRLSTILDVDEILVIRNGQIIERGTHTDLILQDGYYSRLFHLQFKSRNGVASYAK